jgi:xanthine dehydrogenase molybdenum-binding subunit
VLSAGRSYTQVAVRYINCPEGKAPFGPAVNGQLQHATSAFLKEALQRGAAKFNWQGRVARNPKRIGSKVRGVGVSLSCCVGATVSFDGLLVTTPDGRMRFQSGIGNLGTESVIDVHRAGAEVLGVPWEKCDVVLGRHVEASSVYVRVRRQPDLARDDPSRSRRGDGRQAETAGDHRESLGGRSEDYTVANERVFRNGSSGMTLAQAARRAIELAGKL